MSTRPFLRSSSNSTRAADARSRSSSVTGGATAKERRERTSSLPGRGHVQPRYDDNQRLEQQDVEHSPGIDDMLAELFGEEDDDDAVADEPGLSLRLDDGDDRNGDDKDQDPSSPEESAGMEEVLVGDETSSTADSTVMALGETHILTAVRVRPMLPSEKKAGCRRILDMGADGAWTRIVNPASLSSSSHSPTPSTTAAFELTMTSSASHATQFSHDFVFDHSFWSYDRAPGRHFATQQVVYDTVGVYAIQSAWQGYNCSVFAYGQTSAGKTHTMMGDDSGRGVDGQNNGRQGLTPRICHGLFDKIDASKAAARASGVFVPRFQVQVSYVEVYHEKVFDLLAQSKLRHTKESLKVREHPEDGVYVEHAARITVTKFEDVKALLDEGNRMRSVAATKVNQRSSRSHAILTLFFKQQTREHAPSVAVSSRSQLTRGLSANGLSNHREDTGVRAACVTKKSKLCLVDLAGSERADISGASGTRLREAGYINRSLSTLADVISALSKRPSTSATTTVMGYNSSATSQFVPYRNSVLTRLLKESLGGNARTVMLAAVSPCCIHYEETLSTLKYVDRAKSVVNTARVNSESSLELVTELRKEIHELKHKLQPAAVPEDPVAVPSEPRRHTSTNTSTTARERRATSSNDRSRKSSVGNVVVATHRSSATASRTTGTNTAVAAHQHSDKSGPPASSPLFATIAFGEKDKSKMEREIAKLKMLLKKKEREALDHQQQATATHTLEMTRTRRLVALMLVYSRIWQANKHRAFAQWAKCATARTTVGSVVAPLTLDSQTLLEDLATNNQDEPSSTGRSSPRHDMPPPAPRHKGAVHGELDILCASVVNDFFGSPEVARCPEDESGSGQTHSNQDECNSHRHKSHASHAVDIKQSLTSLLSSASRKQRVLKHVSRCLRVIDITRKAMGPTMRRLTKSAASHPLCCVPAYRPYYLERKLLKQAEKAFLTMIHHLTDLEAAVPMMQRKRRPTSDDDGNEVDVYETLEACFVRFCVHVMRPLCEQLGASMPVATHPDEAVPSLVDAFQEHLRVVLEDQFASIDAPQVVSALTELWRLSEHLKTVWWAVEFQVDQLRALAMAYDTLMSKHTQRLDRLGMYTADLEHHHVALTKQHASQCLRMSKTDQELTAVMRHGKILEEEYSMMQGTHGPVVGDTTTMARVEELEAALAASTAGAQAKQARLDRELCEMAAVTKELEAQNIQLQQQCKRYQDDAARRTTELLTVTERMKEVEASAATAAMETDEWKRKSATLQIESTATNGQIRLVEQERDKLREECRAFQEQLLELQAQSDALQAQLSRGTEAKKQRLIEVEAQYSALLTDCAELQAKAVEASKLMVEVDIKEARILKLEAVEASMQAEMSVLYASVAQWEATCTRGVQERAELSAQLEHTKLEVEYGTDRITELTTQLLDLEAQLQTTTTTLTQTQEDVTASRAEWERQLAAMTAKATELEQERDKLSQLVATAESQHTQELGNVALELNALRDSVTQSERDRKMDQDIIRALQEQLNEAEEEDRTKAAEIVLLQEQIDSLSQTEVQLRLTNERKKELEIQLATQASIMRAHEVAAVEKDFEHDNIIRQHDAAWEEKLAKAREELAAAAKLSAERISELDVHVSELLKKNATHAHNGELAQHEALNWKEQLSAMTSKTAELVALVSSLEQANNVKQQEIEALQDQLTSTQQAFSEARMELAHATTAHGKAMKTYDEQMRDAEITGTDLLKLIKDREEKIEVLNHEINGCRSDIAEWQIQCESWETTTQQLREQIARKDTEVTELRDQLTSATDAQNDIASSFERDRQNLQELLAKTKDERENLARRVDDAQPQLAVTEYQVTIASLQERLKTSLEAMQRSKDDHAREIAGVQTQLEEAEHSAAALRSRITELAETDGERALELAQLKNRISAIEDNLCVSNECRRAAEAKCNAVQQQWDEHVLEMELNKTLREEQAKALERLQIWKHQVAAMVAEVSTSEPIDLTESNADDMVQLSDALTKIIMRNKQMECDVAYTRETMNSQVALEKNRNAELAMQLQESQIKLSEVSDLYVVQSNAVAELESELSQLREKCARDHELKRSELETQVCELTLERDKLVEQMATQEEELRYVQAMVTTDQSMRDQSERQAQELATNKETIRQLEEQLRAAEEEVAQLQQAKLAAQMESFTELSAQQHLISQLQAAAAKDRATLAQLTSEIRLTSERLELSEQLVATQERTLVEARQQFEMLIGRAAELEHDHLTMKSQLEHDKVSLELCKHELTAATEVQQALRSRLEESEVQLSDSRQALSELSDQARAQAEKNHALQLECAQLQDEQQQSQTNHDIVSRKCADLEAKLEAMTCDMEDFKRKSREDRAQLVESYRGACKQVEHVQKQLSDAVEEKLAMNSKVTLLSDTYEAQLRTVCATTDRLKVQFNQQLSIRDMNVEDWHAHYTLLEDRLAVVTEQLQLHEQKDADRVMSTHLDSLDSWFHDTIEDAVPELSTCLPPVDRTERETSTSTYEATCSTIIDTAGSEVLAPTAKGGSELEAENVQLR
ncbi:TPA: hypothetical protein N0F65_012163 [Lagenidium giganteum]|uniref:Kinesin motor domain-containing protein n=1 Tax=Lagenidium giganteum TaxID=4803 RepID=A0AAV2YV69_9STRA|nr:TPA: hypothetical protein N0F65_012163 [Lagenidium giganteum]